MQQRILKAIQSKKQLKFSTRGDQNTSWLMNRQERGYLKIKSFLAMDLNDGFFHSRDPWAVNSTVQQGIQAVLMLDQVQEEIQILTQELDHSISWAHDHLGALNSTLKTLGKSSAAFFIIS
jgi:hypothetical protein